MSVTLHTICAQVLSQLQTTRGFAAKEVRFGVDCRSGVLAGVDKLADAVQITLGPKASTLCWRLIATPQLQNQM